MQACICLMNFFERHVIQAPRSEMVPFAKERGINYKIYGFVSPSYNFRYSCKFACSLYVVCSGSVPIMRLYGVTQEGHSVIAHIHGYDPYFWVQVELLQISLIFVFMY
jgi:hypothetical protein